MQPASPFYSRYPPQPFPSPVPSYNPPPPPSYVYQQYSPYPTVTYTHSYTPLVHTSGHPPYGASRPSTPYTPTAASERDAFYRKLHAFRDAIGEPIQRLPTLGFKELDLCALYKEVTKRHGIDAVIAKKQWKEVAEALQLPSSCTDSGFRLRLHYKKYLEAFERKFYAPPLDVDIRPSKKKRPSATSESAETDIDAESSAGSEDKQLRKSPVVKRKKRSGKREKKSDDPSVKDRKADKKDRDPGFGNDQHQGVDKTRTPKMAVMPNVDTERENDIRMESQRQIWPVRSAVANEVADTAEREAARVLVEAKSAGLSQGLRVYGGIQKSRRHKVDFNVLDCATLKRYARVNGVGYDSKAVDSRGKQVLVDCVAKHFSSTPVAEDETNVLLNFIKAVRRR